MHKIRRYREPILVYVPNVVIGRDCIEGGFAVLFKTSFVTLYTYIICQGRCAIL